MNLSPASQAPMIKQRPLRGSARSLPAWLSVAVTFCSTAVHAHPGHDHAPLIPPSHLDHWLIEPEHAVGWLGIGMILWALHQVKKVWTDEPRESRGPKSLTR
jgi:hypothetical protein